MSKNIQLTEPANMLGDILTDEQCCALLAVTPRTLRLWRRERGLPHCKITRRIIRYRKTDIDQWMARHSTAITA
jgi:excisionase family DNA binding protein